MLEEIKKIESELNEKFSSIHNVEDLNDVRTYFLGKKGVVSALGPLMASLSPEEKKECGIKLNDLKNKIIGAKVEKVHRPYPAELDLVIFSRTVEMSENEKTHIPFNHIRSLRRRVRR